MENLFLSLLQSQLDSSESLTDFHQILTSYPSFLPMEHKHEGTTSVDDAVEDSQTTSINDLPNEVLAHIFSIGTGTRKGYPLLALYPSSFPLLVSTVNSHWRRLAQSTPELWTLVIPPIHKATHICLDYTSTYLRRSGALLLSVVLDLRLGRSHAWDASSATFSIPETFALLFKVERARIRRLVILAHETRHLQDVPFHLLQQASHLQQFSLILNAHTGGGSRVVTSTVRTIRWSGINVPPMAPNLTSLNARYLSLTYRDVRALFRTSTHLAHLVLDGILPIVGPIPLAYKHITVGSLQSIAVRCNKQISLGTSYIFHFLEIPNLEYLEVDATLSVSLLFGSSLPPTKIETLRISNHTQTRNPQMEDDLTLLYSFTNLQHLQIKNLGSVTWVILSRLIDAHNSKNAKTLTRTRPTSLSQLGGMSHLGKPLTSHEAVTLSTDIFAQKNSLQEMPWPKLHTLSLDVNFPIDLQYLCDIVRLPTCIKRVELSEHTMDRLSERMRRKGNSIFAAPSRTSSRKIGTNDKGKRDVKKWLAARVDLRLMEFKGLLDVDHVPLSELP